MTNGTDPEIAALLEKGLEHHKAGQYPEAEEAYGNILNKQPDNADALHYLGLLLVIANEPEQAIQLIEQSLSINPNNAAAHSNLGNMLRDAGRFEDALKHLRQSIELDSEVASTQADLGRVLMDTGQLEEAAESLQKAVSLDSNNLEAQSNLGLVSLNLGRADIAAQSFKQAIAINAEIPDLYLNYSLALQEQGQLDEALEQIKKAESMDSSQADFAFNRGTIYQDLGRADEAIEAYERAISLDSNFFQAHCNLGLLLESKDGRVDDALDHYQQALSIEPKASAALVNIANALQNKGEIEEALEHFEKAYALSPDPATEIAMRQLRAKQLPRWHFPMLADENRNALYQKAIEKVITPASNVLDIGTGSGLLAMMAARAGAEKVTACETSSVLAATAQKIIESNGLADRINVINKKSNDLVIGEDLDQPADVIIAEIFDFGLLREGALPTLRHALSQLAAKGVKVIPGSAAVKGMLVELPTLRSVNPIRNIAGFDLSAFDSYRNPYAQIQDLNQEEHRCLSDTFTIATYDFAALSPKPAGGIDEKPLQVKINDAGTVHAVVFWFDLELADGIVLSSGPLEGHSHWGQAVQYFDQDISVKDGDQFPLTACLGEMQITFKV